MQSTPSDPVLPPEPSMMERAMAVPKQLAMRASLFVAFIYAKQPARIKQVLNKVTSLWDDKPKLNLECLKEFKTQPCQQWSSS